MNQNQPNNPPEPEKEPENKEEWEPQTESEAFLFSFAQALSRELGSILTDINLKLDEQTNQLKCLAESIEKPSEREPYSLKASLGSESGGIGLEVSTPNLKQTQRLFNSYSEKMGLLKSKEPKKEADKSFFS